MEGSLKAATISYLFIFDIFRFKFQDVNQIQSSLHAFAALRSDGSVVTWGKLDDGGNSSNVQRGRLGNLGFWGNPLPDVNKLMCMFPANLLKIGM